MTILFDHQIFSIQRYGGISRYFRELIDGVNQHNDKRANLAVYLSDSIYTSRSAPFPEWNFRGRGTTLYKINKAFGKRFIEKGQFDLFHPTYYDPYFLDSLNGKPFVITLYDMTHERLAHQFPELATADQFTAGKYELAHRAEAVIAISENTKRDAVELLGLNPSRVHVVHLANSLQPVVPPAVKPDPYLLFVGHRNHYKNFNGVLTAFSQLTNYPDLQLLCAGGGGFTQVETELVATLNGMGRVVQQGFQTDAELATLYGLARAFIFPSFYEGFGIPILEAFACGCPCLLSQTSSLPEVAGEAALYFDPQDSVSIASAIRLVLNNSEQRQNLINRGYERLSKFTWKKTTEGTIAVYDLVRSAKSYSPSNNKTDEYSRED